MGRHGAAVVILMALMAAVPLHGQEQRSCRQVLPSDFRRLVDVRGQEILYFRDPVRVFCSGGVRLEADSAVFNRGAGTVELVGDVVYQDTIRRLEADWANYLGRLEQLLARGSTRIEELAQGAVITGEQLNYLRETESRPLARLIVTGGRPHAILPAREPADPTPGNAAPDPQAPPDRGPPDAEDPASNPADSSDTHVWADRLEVEGAVFRADGNVELERGELTGSGRTAVYDRELDRMTLSGNARLETESYELTGREVEATLAGDELQDLRSRGRARAVSADLEIRAQRIRIRFDQGTIRGLEAWNVDEDAPRIWAAAEDLQLRADSLDTIADSSGIRELRAIGRAYGERGAPPPADDTTQSDLTAEIGRDWVQGDTILGFFAQTSVPAVPNRDRGPEAAEAGQPLIERPAPAPTTGDSTRTILERVEVVGGTEPALSFYRMIEDEGARMALNFMKARRIVLFMLEGEVQRVEAEGPIEGLYLEPQAVAQTEVQTEDEGDGG